VSLYTPHINAKGRENALQTTGLTLSQLLWTFEEVRLEVRSDDWPMNGEARCLFSGPCLARPFGFTVETGEKNTVARGFNVETQAEITSL
jgi:hypothetical protein